MIVMLSYVAFARRSRTRTRTLRDPIRDCYKDYARAEMLRMAIAD